MSDMQEPENPVHKYPRASSSGPLISPWLLVANGLALQNRTRRTSSQDRLCPRSIAVRTILLQITNGIRHPARL